MSARPCTQSALPALGSIAGHVEARGSILGAGTRLLARRGLATLPAARLAAARRLVDSASAGAPGTLRSLGALLHAPLRRPGGGLPVAGFPTAHASSPLAAAVRPYSSRHRDHEMLGVFGAGVARPQTAFALALNRNPSPCPIFPIRQTSSLSRLRPTPTAARTRLPF